MGLSTIGMILYFLYPVSLIAISIYVSRNKEMTLENYFLSNRSTHWFVLGISLFAASFFSPYYLGITTAVSLSEFPVSYLIISAIVFAVIGLLIVPAFLKIKISTLPEYFEERFGKKFRLALSGLYIVSNIFIRMMIIFAAGNALLYAITGIDAYSSILFFLVVSGLCVIIGGFKAEVYTNIVQLLFIIVAVAGYGIWLYMQSSEPGFSLNKHIKLFNINPVETNGFTAGTLLLGLPIIGFGFWCADQFIVNKILGTDNSKSARRAVITTGILQALPVFIFTAVLLQINIPDELQQRESFGSLFVISSLPVILRGALMLAAASILMASFASLFNSTSALVTFDFYRHFRHESSDRKLVLVGRMSTMIILFLAIMLLPVSQALDFTIYLKLFKLFSYTVSIVAAIFILSILNKRIQSSGAFLSLCIITALVVLQIVCETIFSGQNFNNPLLNWFINPGYFEFTILVFSLTILFSLVLSFTPVLRTVKDIQAINTKALLKLKYEWNMHRAVFLILSALITMAIIGIILI